MKIFTLFFLLALNNTSLAQDQDAPYLKYPSLPNFSILQEDSTSWFTARDIKKGVPVIIVLFSPECDHCKKQASLMTKNMNELRNTEIVMSTFQPIYKMKDFIRQYKLYQYPNVHVGRDVKYFFGPFFRVRSAPFLALYDKNRNLIKVFEGDTKVDKILDALGQN
jgi:thiol-disulfide isomerase/thioredoxin